MTVVRMKMCPPTEANGDDSGENEDVSAYRSKWR